MTSKSWPAITSRHSRRSSELPRNGRARAVSMRSHTAAGMPRHVRNRSASCKSFMPSMNSRASAFRAWPALSLTVRNLRPAGFTCWSASFPRCSRSRRFGTRSPKSSIGFRAPSLIRERIVDLPTGSQGRSLIEMIRFAAANRLLAEIDRREKQGNRATRAIEACSLRRSKAGNQLLMAARADTGQPRSCLVNSILGVQPTQTQFAPRHPDGLTPSGPQSIPRTARFGSRNTFGAGGTRAVRRSPARRLT